MKKIIIALFLIMFSVACHHSQHSKKNNRNLSSHKGSDNPACGTCYTCCKVEGYSSRECADACSSDRQE